MNPILISFLFFLTTFMGVGLLSVRWRKDTAEDYLLANRSIGPWGVALSAVATNNSGFMFIGLIGETFEQGLCAMWVIFGWVVGDYLMWLLGVPHLLRKRSAEWGVRTIPSFLAGPNASRTLTVVAGVLTFVFLGIYAAAQLNAGSKALEVTFDLPSWLGVVLGAVIVILYCFAGGIRASIWTDVMQSCVMLVAMLTLCVTALIHLGGFDGMWSTLNQIDERLTAWSPPTAPAGFGLFILGWLFAGAGVVGQPHIMVRVMTMADLDGMAKARRIYFVWNALFAAAAILVGLAARALLDSQALSDPELALPTLAQHLFPSMLVGLILAGVFAATMSTADSQVLSCSAALTQDIFPQVGNQYNFVKGATLLVTGFVLFVALFGGSVFDLIVLAWSSLAAGLGPLLVLRAFDRPVNQWVALTMILGGLFTVVVWRFLLGWTAAVYDAAPAILVSFMIYGVSCIKWRRQTPGRLP